MAEQRQRQRQLGRAPSTIRVDGSVINFYNTFRALKGKTTTFEQMLPAEIENDNLENEMVDLMYFCSNNPIPRAPFNAGFLPRGSGPIKILSSDSLLQYVGNIIKLLCNKFPEHDAFANLEEREQPEFWKRLRPQFSAALGQYHIKIGSDYQFGEITVRPLYSSNLFTAPYADSVEYVSAIDLKYICKELIRSADAAGAVNDGSLQHRAIILTTFLAAARGEKLSLSTQQILCFTNGLGAWILFGRR